MARFDASSAKCVVLTYKEGLLSPIAHDLQIEVTRLTVDVDDEVPRVRCELDAGSLRVVAAMKEGRPHHVLSDRDKREIEKNIRDDVLHAKRHPTILFESTQVAREGDGFGIAGELSLHGATHSIRTRAVPEGDLLVAEVLLHQPDWGIEPYRAALGALRVRADVRVRVSLPRAAIGVEP